MHVADGSRGPLVLYWAPSATVSQGLLAFYFMSNDFFISPHCHASFIAGIYISLLMLISHNYFYKYLCMSCLLVSINTSALKHHH